MNETSTGAESASCSGMCGGLVFAHDDGKLQIINDQRLKYNNIVSKDTRHSSAFSQYIYIHTFYLFSESVVASKYSQAHIKRNNIVRYTYG